MRLLSTLLSAVALTGALVVGSRQTGPVPPLGPLLNPATGIWSVARVADLPRTDARRLTGLGGDVDVRYDDRGVPHIWASDERDMARALGWVHARDRLFQMELIQRAVAGTLTELVGARALPLDRNVRQLGLAAAAERKWAAIPDSAATRQLVVAYIDGVNQYVRGMRPQDLPLEYRLLGRRPRLFNPQDTYYLLVRMSQTLSYQEAELRFHALEQVVGREAASALIPVDAPIQEPIEPVDGRTAPRFAATRLPPPRRPDAARIAAARRLRDDADAVAARYPTALAGSVPPDTDGLDALTRGEAVVGSNNWAVAPSRSASGHALLAGDPHLELTLPSIWYEVHLVVPGVLDVYGVSLPLSPIVPIGFNREVAWTMTNTGNDVVDYYRETVDDTASPRRYRVDGAWRDLTRRVERFRDPAGQVLAEDTAFSTHRGPLLQTSLGWMSQRWTAREASDEGAAFHRVATATSSVEFYARMTDYRTPAQNMLTADRRGSIGIRSTGRYPIRPGDGRGDRIFDGSSSASDWIADRPVSWYPQSINPRQGYLASANQQPLDPALRPGYHGSDWPSPWRAMRINRLLRENARVTPEDMRRYQTDPESEFTPFVLAVLDTAMRRAARAGQATDADRAAAGALGAWDRRFTPSSSGAVLFDALVSALVKHTWDELVLPGEERRVATPSQMILVQLFRDPTSVWWDDRSTAEVEDRDAIVLRALREAWTVTRTRHGDDPSRWEWQRVRVARIHHLLRLPGFGRDSIPVPSGPGTLAPADAQGTHGASWRFVVELAPEIRAWGTYPGGQSGNPVSPRYDDRLATWQRGDLSELRVPATPDALGIAQTMATLRFTPAEGRAR